VSASNRTPDQASATFARSTDHLTLNLLDNETVLVEGTKQALLLLSNLIRAQAEYSADCGFQISPAGAGSKIFSKAATLGLYIHRLPCNSHKKSNEDVP
jgi:hypothetical protein